MIIIGEKEVKEKCLSIRRHTQGDLGVMNVENFCSLVKEEVKDLLASF